MGIIEIIDKEGATLDEIEFDTGYVVSFGRQDIYCILDVYDDVDGGIPSSWEMVTSWRMVKTSTQEYCEEYSKEYRVYKVPLPKVVYHCSL